VKALTTTGISGGKEEERMRLGQIYQLVFVPHLGTWAVFISGANSKFQGLIWMILPTGLGNQF
jgi:hypothetical protein